MAQPRLGSTEPWGLSPPSMLKNFGLKSYMCLFLKFVSMPHLFNRHFPQVGDFFPPMISGPLKQTQQ